MDNGITLSSLSSAEIDSLKAELKDIFVYEFLDKLEKQFQVQIDLIKNSARADFITNDKEYKNFQKYQLKIRAAENDIDKLLGIFVEYGVIDYDSSNEIITGIMKDPYYTQSDDFKRLIRYGVLSFKDKIRG